MFKMHYVFAVSATIPCATAATAHSDDAADIPEPVAAIVSFQRH